MQADSQFLNSLIEVSHIEFQSYDIHRHEIIFSSGLAQQVLGYTKEEFYNFGRDIYEELIHPDDIEVMHKALDKIMHSQKNEIVEMTVRYRRSDGNYIWLYTRKLVSKRNKRGDPCTITTVAEDITNMVYLQEQLKEKVQLLRSISYKNSHLLRSPVASIIGLINLIEEKDITSSHNLQVFSFLKMAIEKLDAVVHEINEASQK